MPEIKGYRQLTQEELDLINAIKEHEVSTAALMKRVHDHLAQRVLEVLNCADDEAERRATRIDRAQPQRWAAKARTDFQVAYMALVRAVAQPESPL